MVEAASMTFSAKVLTVLIFVLSLVFAAAAGILFTKRTDYTATLSDLQKGLNTQIANLKKVVETKDEEVSKWRREFEKLSEDLRGARREVAREKRAVEAKETQVHRLDKLLSDAKMADKQNRAMLAAADKRRDLIEKQLERRKQELERTRKLLLVEKEKATDLARDLATTRAEKDKLAAQRRSLAMRVERFEKMKKQLEKLHYADTQTMTVLRGQDPLLKDIRGRVLRVDAYGNVIINRGLQDGVLKDYLFTVYRDSNFIARIRIFRLDRRGDLAAGRIENRNPKYQVKQGDMVATRLIP